MDLKNRLITFFIFFTIVFLGKTFAQPLSGILPKSNSYIHSQIVNFEWNEIINATSYNVVISSDPTFLVIDFQSGPITTTNWVSSVIPFGSWCWKVQATTSNGITESSINVFDVYKPTNCPNLILWLDPNQGVVLDASNKVSEWVDQSSNAFSFSQLTPSKRPVINPSSLNGLASIMFAGGQVLDGGDILDIGTASRSMFIMGNMGGTNQTLFAKSIASGLPNRFALMKDGTSTAFIYHDIMNSAIYSTTSTSSHAFYKVLSNRATANNTLFLNNNSLGSQPLSTSFDFNSTFRFLIGAYNNASDNNEVYYLNGNINEIIFLNTVEPTETNKISSYLQNKYSQPINLGKDTTSTNFCSITLNAPAGFTNLLWSNGATSNTISITDEGLYWLEGKDAFGFISRDTIMVNYPTINETINTNICVGSSAVWDPQLGAGYTYAWNTGAVSSTLTINATGNYSVVVTDGLGCTKNSDTLSFVIDNYENTASLGNDTTFCAGNYIELVSNAAETVSYKWQGNSSPSQPSSYQISATGDYWLESTDVNGCVAQDTLHVIVSGTAPTAIFNGLNSCLGSANSFTDGSAGVVGDPVTSWSWDFGDGLGVSSAQNPAYSYSSPGIYTVELYALSQGGCGAYHSEQVEVYALPIASYIHTGHCTDQVMQFTNQSTAGGAVINQYAWNFGQPSLGAMNVSSVQNPYRTFTSAGTYPMTLTVTDAHLCVDDTIMQIVVNATPIIDVFAADACQNEQVQFTNATIVETPALYYWTFGDNTNSVLPSPIKQYATEGTKTITVKVTAANGCFTSDTIQMTVHAVPVASFDLGPHCKGAYTEVQSTSTITSGTIADLFWVVNLTDTLYGDTTGYEITSINQQQIQLFVTSDFGCSDEQNIFFDPEGAISAAFTLPSTVVACGEAVAFTNASLGATNYSWSLGNDSTSTAVNPTTTYDCSYQDSTVSIQLIASNSLGCIDTAFASVFIGEYAIDLQVDNIYFQANGVNAILGAELKNMGTAPLTTIDLDVFSEAGFVFHEVWTGTLLPNQTEIYVFSNQPAMTLHTEDDVLSYYCIRGTGYSNTEAETDYSNNEVCKNIENSEVVLKPLYPNPTGSTITMGIIVPQSSEVAADLVDDQGRVVKQLIYPFTIAAGEYTYVFDLNSIANGTYALRFTVDGKTELYRLVVLH